MMVKMDSGVAERIRGFWDTLCQSRFEKHLLAEINRLTTEKEALQAKVERMEVALLSQTRMGAAYVQTIVPKVEQPLGGPSRPGSWAQIQADHIRQLEEEEAKEKLRKEN